MNSSENQTGFPMSEVTRYIIFFALVYIVAGLAGLIGQPFNAVLVGMGLDAGEIQRMTLLLSVPWLLKPLYGALSDWFPLFGYHRKSYLILFNAVAAAGFLWLSMTLQMIPMLSALFITAVGLAGSNTICGALMVEAGQKNDKISQFLSQQYFWFSIAQILTFVAAGYLAAHFAAGGSLHIAAIAMTVAPLVVLSACWFLIPENRISYDRARMKQSQQDMLKLVLSRNFLLVALFLFCWNFNPGVTGSVIFEQWNKVLLFDQTYIGYLNAINAAGGLAGTIASMYWLSKRFTLRTLLYISVITCAIGQAAYALQFGAISAGVVSALNGFIGMIGLLSILTLAARACPKNSQGLLYALLMTAFHISSMSSRYLGSFIYDYFHHQFPPLIWVSVGCTVLCLPLVHFLKTDENGNKLM